MARASEATRTLDELNREWPSGRLFEAYSAPATRLRVDGPGAPTEGVVMRVTSAPRSVLLVMVLAAIEALAGSDPASNPGSDGQAVAPQVGGLRSATDADLVWKEWESPVTFEVDASWLVTAPLRELVTVGGLPRFYCDDVTLDWLEAKKLDNPKTGGLKLKLHMAVSARRQEDDKVVALEFSLLAGENRIALGRVEGLELDAGDSDTWWTDFNVSREAMERLAAPDAKPRLQVTMIVRVN